MSETINKSTKKSKVATATIKVKTALPAVTKGKVSVKTTAKAIGTAKMVNAKSDPKKTAAARDKPVKQITSTVGKPAAVASRPKTFPAVVKAEAPQSRTSLSRNNVGSEIGDKIHRTAVLKATEVATKTVKTNSSASADGVPLSEAQLIKMGDKDYMNEAQLAFFKARLQQLEKDLLKNAGETTEHLRETVLVPDPADRATIEEEHALELRTRDRERKLLKKVQQSIASIDGGEYGWCEETGEPIGIPRLLARPTATLSLEAQQRRELKQKLYGD